MMALKDSELSVGLVVWARFTNNHRVLSFRGEIVKLNKNTVLVESLVDGVNGWGAGHNFIIQLERSPLHSANNGLFAFKYRTGGF